MHQRIAACEISPTQATAGEAVIVALGFRVGSEGFAPGSRLTIDCPGYLGASRPQFLYQEQEGFVTVDIDEPDVPWRGWVATVDRARKLLTRDDYLPLAEKAYRPFRLIELEFPRGVTAGTRLTVRLGAGGGGFTPGYRVGSVAPRPDFPYRFLVALYADADAAAPMEEHALALRVTGGKPAAARVVRHAGGRVHLAFVDAFGNPSPVSAPEEHVRIEGDAFTANDHAVFASTNRNVRVQRTGNLPLADAAPMSNVFDGLSLFWGDLHTHSAFSCDVKVSERSEMRPADMFAFAQRGSCLDFLSLTDHHFVDGSERALTAAEWDETARAVAAADRPGEFVAIAGYEHRCRRGDTVVIFAETPSFAEICDPANAPVERLWSALAHRGVLTMPHYHNPGSLPEGEWIGPDDIRVEPVQEVFSCHGRFDVARFDGMALAPPLVKLLRADRNAAWLLQRGRRYGTMCSSDGHKGRPGANGLVAVFAPELTRAALFDALRRRRCYGTTNARIRLVFAVNGELMGGEVRATDRGRLRLDVRGTAPLRCVDVLRDGELCRRFRPAGDALTEEWETPLAAGERYEAVVTQADQEMAFSSPIWVDE